MPPDEFAEIAVDVPVAGTFTYRIPESMLGRVVPGVRVRVPFGRRTLTGIAFRTGSEGIEGAKEIREILDGGSPFLPPAILDLLERTARYYHHPLGKVVATAIPGGLDPEGEVRLRQQTWYRLIPDAPLPRGPRQREILEWLGDKGGWVRRDELLEQFPSAGPLCAKLLEAGLIEKEEREVTVDEPPSSGSANPLPPTDEQVTALKQITAALDAHSFAPMLLYGVTGSGKTEVYLQAINHALASGRKALVLVPEISLTPQLIDRFRTRFAGRHRIRVLHSGLSDGERQHSWRQVAAGEAEILIGVRSAVFAPITNLGVIIVDEEHEATYKQGDGLRYHARDLALMRGQYEQAVVLLGSATPSLASYRHALTGHYQLLPLTRRATSNPLPEVELVDLCSQRPEEGITPALAEAIAATLARKEQVLLLLNRRGFSPFLLCEECGTVFRCPNCEITLTYFQDAGKMRCSYCDYADRPPETCPSCNGNRIAPTGIGTERLEEGLKARFPGVRIARMDSDSTRRKGSLREMIGQMHRREIDILVGTQMLAKGHDFPSVTLCGIIDADSALNFPDFRSAERTYALLSQAAGRAGRGDQPGRVLIQTRTPDHPAILAALTHEPAPFYEEELRQREELGYPPHGHLANLVVSAIDSARVATACHQIMQLIGTPERIEVLGPAPCPLSRLRGKHRWQILLKAPERSPLHRSLHRIDANRKLLPGGVSLHIDVDPVDML